MKYNPIPWEQGGGEVGTGGVLIGMLKTHIVVTW